MAALSPKDLIASSKELLKRGSALPYRDTTVLDFVLEGGHPAGMTLARLQPTSPEKTAARDFGRAYVALHKLHETCNVPNPFLAEVAPATVDESNRALVPYNGTTKANVKTESGSEVPKPKLRIPSMPSFAPTPKQITAFSIEAMRAFLASFVPAWGYMTFLLYYGALFFARVLPWAIAFWLVTSFYGFLLMICESPVILGQYFVVLYQLLISQLKSSMRVMSVSELFYSLMPWGMSSPSSLVNSIPYNSSGLTTTVYGPGSGPTGPTHLVTTPEPDHNTLFAVSFMAAVVGYVAGWGGGGGGANQVPNVD